jgi:acetylglutamate kinase
MALIVVKIGGEVVAGPELDPLCADVRVLVDRGDDIVIVHGGGPQATELSQRLGLEVKQVGGRRITDRETLDVMKMTLAGRINVDLCAALCKHGLRPVGLHGASSLVIEARRRPPRVVSGGGPDPIDFGYVGDVVGFNLGLIEVLWGADNVPVLACLGADTEGNVYNINADIVANQLAAATNADHLFLVTSVPGVLKDVKDPSSRIPKLSAEEARLAISEGTIAGGMIPKVEEALKVLDGGVGAIHILGKLSEGDLVRAVDSPGSVGTSLIAD